MKGIQFRSKPITSGMMLLFIAVFISACSGGIPNTGAQATPTVGMTSTAAGLAVEGATAEPGSSPLSGSTQSPGPSLPALTVTPGAGASAGPLNATAQAQAPACTVPAPTTPALTEGPYYKAGAPERSSLLEPGMGGTRLVITGTVLDTQCQPVAGARLDFWQADAEGAYDNSGYRLRGYQFTDSSGRYRLDTIIPGEYPGRTEHIHVKVQAPNGPVLTSQLYFPDVSVNQTDRIFDQRLLVNIINATDGVQAEYNFIVDR